MVPSSIASMWVSLTAEGGISLAEEEVASATMGHFSTPVPVRDVHFV